jgi:CHAT domain-containing protein/Tfp pilus assembly protein PilF
VLLLACALSAAGRIESALHQDVEPSPLAADRAFRREIGGSERHYYSVRLKAGEYARLLVEQQGIDVVLTVFDAEVRRAQADRPNTAHGREAISFIAARDGEHRVEVRSLERIAPRGWYTIRIAEVRPSTPRDESRMAAEQAVTEGETLRARKTAVSLPQGLEKFNQAVALWRALDEPYEVAVALFGRCVTERQLGNSAQAVASCSESLAMMRALDDAHGIALAGTGRAWAYVYLGETDKALADFEGSLAVRRKVGDQPGESFDLFGAGWVYVLRGNYDRAAESFRQSLAILTATGDPRGRAPRVAAIGEVYRRTGAHARAVEQFEAALRLSREAGGDRHVEADTLTSLGWSYFALGQLAEAQRHLDEALPMRRATGDRTGEAVTLLGLAHVERGRGNLHNARLQVESAIAIIESLRSQVAVRPLRLSFNALTQDYYEFYVDLLMRVHRLDSSRGADVAAFEASERGRARGLLELLGEAAVDVREGVSPELLERERTLRARLNAAANYQRQLLSESYTTAQAAAAAKDVDDLAAALGEAEAQIRRASPRYAALVHPQVLDAAAIRRDVVDADTTLLEYALGKERSYLWAVTRSSVTAYELPPGPEIEAAALRLRELLTARGRDLPGETAAQKRARVAEANARRKEEAARLSRMLLAPVAAQLGDRRLLVVASGALHLIPFGALPSPASTADEPLILTHEIVTAPSASAVAMLRREPAKLPPATRSISILADPVFSRGDERFTELAARGTNFVNSALRDHAPARPSVVSALDREALPRLFRTRWEAEQIAALAGPDAAQMLDFAASREAASGAIVSSSRIVHFATHALVNDAHPELSAIALSMFDPEGQPRDGFLRAHDLFNLKLSGELVVLSACSTAVGRDYRGEGLVGLARGFMYAGVPRVVGSLWATDDKATAELMVSFYRKMLKERLRPAAALRATQAEMWREQRWQEPYFWAGFVLQGEWR